MVRCIAMENETELEDYEEEVAGTVLGCGSDEVSIMSVVYPRRSVNVSSLGSSLYIVFYSKTFHYYLPHYILARNIQ